MPAAVECPAGQGRAILLGTQPPAAWWHRLIRDLAGHDPHAATPGVVVCPRTDADGNPAVIIAVNTAPTAGSLVLDGTRRELAPYDVLIAPLAREHRRQP
jgi:hypothetical protein